MDKKPVYRVKGCSPHTFKLRDSTIFPKVYICSKCKNALNEYELYWYNKGLAHGRQQKSRTERG